MKNHKNNKDIGEIIEERLEENTFKAPEQLWDTIDTSLNKKRQQIRTIISATTIAILLLTSIYFLINTATNTKTPIVKIDKNPIADNESEITHHKKTCDEIDTIFKETSITQNTNTFQNKENTKHPPLNFTTTKETIKPPKKATEITDIKDPLEGFEKKTTTYYYYNNKDSTSYTFTDKKMIDSILNLQIFKVDSLKQE